MKVIGTLAEVLHTFDAMASACEGCPARDMCRYQDELEEQQGVPENKRACCKDMLARAVDVELTDKPRVTIYGNGAPVAAEEVDT